MKDGQDAVFAFLANPATHKDASHIKRIDTHGAVVFLAGSTAYKVKRGICYPYMDFSTLAKRKAACEAEIAINREYAPDIYLAAVPITRDKNGFHINGPGDIVEWAVHMRRFNEEATLDRLADKCLIDARLIDQMAQVVSDVHRKAPLRSGAPAAIALHNVMKESLDELALRTAIFSVEIVQPLRANLFKAYRQNEMLLFRRALNGKVRRCHGDLHLRNIVLQDNKPVLFDAIEFNESIAAIDILYDLAFLIMDLCERGLDGHACRLLNHYLWLSNDEADEVEGLALLPLFLSLRATIRAKVLATQADLAADGGPLRAEARKYAEAALRFLAPAGRRLVAIGGLSGTGKSVLATALAPHFGGLPGALHLRSDIERKKAAGYSQFVRLVPDAYSPAVSARVYSRLRELAAAALRAGRSVIVDATFLKEGERKEIERIVARTGASFQGLWLQAPTDLLESRIRERRHDASDATVEVVEAQATQDTGAISWQRIDASQPLDITVARSLGVLEKAIPQ
jgi:uncharacterized protein